ncbi:hypothetical protein DF186_24925, partial [Enterococcus hirae]
HVVRDVLAGLVLLLQHGDELVLKIRVLQALADDDGTFHGERPICHLPEEEVVQIRQGHGVRDHLLGEDQAAVL